jgi:hypothetical protein
VRHSLSFNTAGRPRSRNRIAFLSMQEFRCYWQQESFHPLAEPVLLVARGIFAQRQGIHFQLQEPAASAAGQAEQPPRRRSDSWQDCASVLRGLVSSPRDRGAFCNEHP